MSLRTHLRTLAAGACGLGLVLLLPAPASADTDVNDFDYSSWDARYDVSLDDDGRARMHVTETLTAEFPDRDQNRGIVYGLAERYEGASLDTTVLSVTDESGSAVPYETDSDDGLLYILTGTDEYVHGTTTYVIEYEMRDTILAADTGVDEFYWDLLPLDSTQDIGAFHAEIVFDTNLSAHLTGDARCYEGTLGENRECPLDAPQTTDGRAVFTVDSGARTAGDGITVAIGFDAGTAVQPPARLPNPTLDIGPLAVGGASLAVTAAGIGGFVGFTRRRRRATGVVVAQYEVPADLPPLVAAPLLSHAQAVVPAEIIHLAVNGVLRVEERQRKKQKKTPRLQLRRGDDARVGDPLDAAMRDALFLTASAEDVARLPASSEAFAGRMAALQLRGVQEAASRGFTTRARSRATIVLQSLSLVLLAVAGAFLIAAGIAGREPQVGTVIVFLLAFAAAVVGSIIAFSRHTVLTPEGARRHEHLLGVREFIRVAEADRLRMLQSYTGAERRSDGSVDILHLYERLLPYAMLFGQEREWGDVLETAYATAPQPPSWVETSVGISIGTRIAAFSSAAQSAATYSAPSADTSSSTGGSFGGGFSGGGGGGGFSGGR